MKHPRTIALTLIVIAVGAWLALVTLLIFTTRYG